MPLRGRTTIDVALDRDEAEPVAQHHRGPVQVDDEPFPERPLERELRAEEVPDDLLVDADEEPVGRHERAVLRLGDQLADPLVLALQHRLVLEEVGLLGGRCATRQQARGEQRADGDVNGAAHVHPPSWRPARLSAGAGWRPAAAAR